MRLIHFGRRYYDWSSTTLGVLCHEDGTRSDWGKVEIAIEAGEEVTIRPATVAEHLRLCDHLDRIIDSMATPTNGWLYGTGNYEVAPDDLPLRVSALKRRARDAARGTNDAYALEEEH